MPFSAAPGSTCASPSGLRSPFNVSASQGPATTWVQSASRIELFGRGIDLRSGEQPHGLREGQAVLVRRLLDVAEVVEHAAQLFAVDLDPAPAHQRQSIRLGQQLFDLGGLSASPSSVTSIRKSSSASCPIPAGDLPPTMPVTRGRGGRLPRHAAGMRTTTPAASSSGTSLKSCMASAGVQRSGWIDLAGIDHARATTGNSPKPAARAAAETAGDPCWRAPEYSRRAWPSGRCWALACAESRVRVGREKGERRVRILAILGQIEMHAADQVPRRVATLQKLLDVRIWIRQARVEMRASNSRHKPRGRRPVKILRSGHRRRRQRDPLHLFLGGLGHLQFPSGVIEIRLRA